MAQSDRPAPVPVSTADNGGNANSSLWRRLFGRDSTAPGVPDFPTKEQGSQSGGSDGTRPGLIRRVSRKVVPGLPRAQTFKRQQSEVRNKLEPVQPSPAERRAVSVDRRLQSPQNGSQTYSNPRSSAPNFNHQSFSAVSCAPSVPSVPAEGFHEKMIDDAATSGFHSNEPQFHDSLHTEDGHSCLQDAMSTADCQSITTSQYDALIHEELERTWILNLSMHFRDKSKREKFFVTYRERPTLWRRVTISVDYRNAPENSLELELAHIKYQRDKIAKIYDAIRESLIDIQFYPTVTNLKLQTTEGRLHVHVVEDVNEIIHYPSVRSIQHMRCNRVKERDIEFDSHISGFVYKVRVNDEVLIKKEIPGPDTVDEFLYEINALNRLKHSNHVIRFYGVIVDDNQEHVKGLLISHAEQGALIDIIYDQIHPLPWTTREKWARQIVAGLSEIHEAGFVQGDFTLSNIVIDDDDDAKIIDINRRGCPVGWEPPEATPLIESNQRISMYIGVKSDLYQLGMVLWSLAMKDDEPEAHGRPLRIGPDVPDVPNWYRRVVDICLSDDPRGRMPALQLLSIFPDPGPESDVDGLYDRPSISVDDGVTRQEYFVDADPTANGYPRVRTVQPASDWSYVGWGHSYVTSPNGVSDEPFFYPTRGRSPPSPLPSNPEELDPSKYGYRTGVWASTTESARTAASEPDADTEEEAPRAKHLTPRGSQLSVTDAGQSRVATDQPEPKPVAVRPTENPERRNADLQEVDGHDDTTHKQGGPEMPEEHDGPQQRQAAGHGASHPPLEAKGHPKERDAGTEDSLADSAAIQHKHDEAETLEAGLTEPAMQQHTSRTSLTEDGRPPHPGREVSQCGGSADVVQRIEQPSIVAAKTTEAPSEDPPSKSSIDAAHSATSEGTEDENDLAAHSIAVNETDSTTGHTEHTAPSAGPGDVPDDLKGVGSTYESGPDNWHRSMTNNDIADLIDAEMAAGTKNDSSNDTTVTNDADIRQQPLSTTHV